MCDRKHHHNVALHCKMQHTTTHCNTPQLIATHHNTLQCTAICGCEHPHDVALHFPQIIHYVYCSLRERHLQKCIHANTCTSEAWSVARATVSWHLCKSWHVCISHGTYVWVMAHTNEQEQTHVSGLLYFDTYISHDTYIWVMEHTNESWHVSGVTKYMCVKGYCILTPI